MTTFRIDPDSDFTFATARDAINAVSEYEASTTRFLSYAVKPVFSGSERAVTGYVARVSDLDGFALGNLTR
jgi:hypothetical protein